MQSEVNKIQRYSLMKESKRNSCVAVSQFKEQNVTKTSEASWEPLSSLILSAPPKGSYSGICVHYSLLSWFPFVCFSEQYLGILKSV